MCVKVSFRSVAYVCVGFPHICVCRISRASGVPLFTYFHQIHTSHYLPDYLHLIIQACHYLPIPALITGSVSIQSNSNYNIYALQSRFTCTICALLQLYSTICALHALNVFYMHYMRASAAVFNALYMDCMSFTCALYVRFCRAVFNALEFCSLVSGDNCGECNAGLEGITSSGSWIWSELRQTPNLLLSASDQTDQADQIQTRWLPPTDHHLIVWLTPQRPQPMVLYEYEPLYWHTYVVPVDSGNL